MEYWWKPTTTSWIKYWAVTRHQLDSSKYTHTWSSNWNRSLGRFGRDTSDRFRNWAEQSDTASKRPIWGRFIPLRIFVSDAMRYQLTNSHAYSMTWRCRKSKIFQRLLLIVTLHYESRSRANSWETHHSLICMMGCNPVRWVRGWARARSHWIKHVNMKFTRR